MIFCPSREDTAAPSYCETTHPEVSTSTLHSSRIFSSRYFWLLSECTVFDMTDIGGSLCAPPIQNNSRLQIIILEHSLLSLRRPPPQPLHAQYLVQLDEARVISSFLCRRSKQESKSLHVSIIVGEIQRANENWSSAPQRDQYPNLGDVKYAAFISHRSCCFLSL